MSWWNDQGAPTGPYSHSYNFTKAKRRNPDIVIDSPSGPMALVPHYGAQDRQEAIAALLTEALALAVCLKQAVEHSKGLSGFDVDKAQRTLDRAFQVSREVSK